MKPFSTFLIGILFAFLNTADAQVLDPTFGESGMYEALISGGSPRTNLVRPYGTDRLLLGGICEREPVARSYSSDFYYWIGCTDLKGNPVQDFGQKGNIYIKAKNEYKSRVVDLLIDEQNRVIAVCRNEHEIFLFRFDKEGELDVNFGIQGKVRLYDPEVTSFEIKKIMRTDDKKILLLNNYRYRDTSSFSRLQTGLALYQFLPSGDLDPSFAENGKFSLEEKQEYNPGLIPIENLYRIYSEGMTILPDEELLLLGYLQGGFPDEGSATRTFMLKLDKHGKIDESYQEKGFSFHHESEIERPELSIVLPDGSFLISGRKGNRSTRIITKLKADGEVDGEFGEGGLLTYPTSLDSEKVYPFILRLSPWNTIHLLCSESSRHYMCQYSLAGKLDADFGTNGMFELRTALFPIKPKAVYYSPTNAITYWYGTTYPGFGRLTMKGYPDPTYDPPDNQLRLKGSGSPLKMELDEKGRLWVVGNGVQDQDNATLNIDDYYGFIQSFSSNGDTKDPLTSYEGGQQFVIRDMVLTSKEQIIVTGYRPSGDFVDGFVQAFKSDGTPDETFGIGSRSPYSGGGYDNSICRLANGNLVLPGYVQLSPQGEILKMKSLPIIWGGKFVADWVGENGEVVALFHKTGDLYLKHINPSWTQDTIFVQAGMADKLEGFQCVGMEQDEMNRFILGGSKAGEFQLQAYSPEGTPDLQFAQDGLAKTIFADGVAEAKAFQSLPDGKFLLVGSLKDRTTDETSWLIARYLKDGMLDPDFADQGLLIVPFEAGTAVADCATVDEEWNLYVAGTVKNDIMITKFIPELSIAEPEEEAHMIVFPNPISQIARVRYELVKAQSIQFSLYNLNGAPVYDFAEQMKDAGRHVDRLIFPEGITPGWYVLRMRRENGMSSVKVVLK